MDDSGPTVDDIAQRYRAFAGAEGAGSSLYAGLARHIAETPELLGLLHQARPSQRLPVALFAAVHALVLSGDAPTLAPFYPSAGGAESPDEAIEPFAAFCRSNEAELLAIIASRTVQTNEVRRSVFLHLAFRLLAELQKSDELPAIPIRLIELGTSAGLLLLHDRYRYEIADDVTGDPDSGLTLTTELRGPRRPPAEPAPPIADRVGLDLNPLDVTDEADRTWLRACLWPDQLERTDRLNRALAIAVERPPDLRVGNMVADGPALIAETPGDQLPVVVHAWATAYLSRDERRSLARSLDAIGNERPLALISLEAPGLVPGIVPPPRTGDPGEDAWSMVGLTTWNGRGDRRNRRLARVHAHGVWTEWLNDEPGPDGEIR